MPTQPTTIALCLLALPVAAQGRNREPLRAPTLEHGTFETHSFESEAIGGKSEYGVYLPPGYHDPENRERRYPLVVWLHGMFEDHRRFHLRGGTEVLDRMTGAGEFPEAVFVTADGGRSFYINGARTGRYEDLVAVDLLEHAEKTYRIARARAQRGLMGVSMGGYGALKIAFKHPERFGVVAVHSAAVLTRDPDRLEEQFPWLQRWGGGQRLVAGLFGDPLDRQRWAQENLLILADGLDLETLAGLKIYMDCGDQDRYGFAAPNRELHEILEGKGVAHAWRLVEGGNHGWRAGYNQTALPHSLKFVAAAWAAAKGASGLQGLLPGAPEGKRGDAGPDRERRR